MRAWPLLLFLCACPESVPVFIYPDATASPDADGGPADTGAVTPDSGTVADVGPHDAGATDSGASGCGFDPFEQCSDPTEMPGGNDTWADADRLLSTSIGCLSGDEFTGTDTTIDHVICPGEIGDYFGFTVVPCDTRTLFLEFRFTPADQCTADVAFEFLSGGGVVGCDSGRFDIECTQDGPTSQVRVEIEPGNSIYSLYIGVRRVAERVRVPYSVRVRML